MTKPKFAPLTNYREHPLEEMKQRATAFYMDMQRRRTVRHFSDRPVSREIVEDCLCAASTAPSGAHLQPWHFLVVTDPIVKRAIRVASENAEHEFYNTHAPEEWLEALTPLGTNMRKPFLETAPCLIVIFAQNYGMLPNKRKIKHYYVPVTCPPKRSPVIILVK